MIVCSVKVQAIYCTIYETSKPINSQYETLPNKGSFLLPIIKKA